MKVILAGLFLAASLGITGSALAQNYRVQTMNYDLWCQEQAKLPAERCDKRLPEDEKVFDAYRASVEQYEIPYLQQKDNASRLDQNLLHNDPVDNPVTRNQGRTNRDITVPQQPQ